MYTLQGSYSTKKLTNFPGNICYAYANVADRKLFCGVFRNMELAYQFKSLNEEKIVVEPGFLPFEKKEAEEILKNGVLRSQQCNTMVYDAYDLSGTIIELVHLMNDFPSLLKDVARAKNNCQYRIVYEFGLAYLPLIPDYLF